MGILNFEDIIAWQKAKELTLALYKIFSGIKDFGFRDQIQRASVSVMNNISEGFERKTNNEFKHFLFIAKGSCGEVRSMLYLGKELKMLSEKEFNELLDIAKEVSEMISGHTKHYNFNNLIKHHYEKA